MKPVVVILNYGERWIKAKIDIVELVTMRESGLTFDEIAVRVGTKKGTVWRYIKRHSL